MVYVMYVCVCVIVCVCTCLKKCPPHLWRTQDFCFVLYQFPRTHPFSKRWLRCLVLGLENAAAGERLPFFPFLGEKRWIYWYWEYWFFAEGRVWLLHFNGLDGGTEGKSFRVICVRIFTDWNRYFSPCQQVWLVPGFKILSKWQANHSVFFYGVTFPLLIWEGFSRSARGDSLFHLHLLCDWDLLAFERFAFACPKSPHGINNRPIGRG